MNLRATVLRNAAAGMPGPSGDELFDFQPVEAAVPCMIETDDDTEVVQQGVEAPVIRWNVVFAEPHDVRSDDQLDVEDVRHPEYGVRRISVVGPLADLEGRHRLWQVKGIEHP